MANNNEPWYSKVTVPKPSPPAGYFKTFCSMIGGWTFVSVVMVLVNDWLDGPVDGMRVPFHESIALFYAVYLAIIILLRMWDHGSYVLFEMNWACNQAFIVSIVGMLTGRPRLLCACVAGVSMDQLCWYIDIFTYLTMGKFYVGAAKYMVWPETTIIKKITATHHLWFIPINLYAVGWLTPPGTWRLGVVYVAALSVYARFFTPFTLMVTETHKGANGKLEDKQVEQYLNINGAFAFWKDVKIGILHKFNHRHPLIYLPYLIFLGAFAINGPPYVLFVTIAKYAMS